MLAARRAGAFAVVAAVVAAAVVAVLSATGGPARSRAARRTPVPSPPPTSPAPTTTLPRPPFAVGVTSVVLTDSGRELPTVVRYPAATAGNGAAPLRSAGPFPLIVFSQGFDISPEAYAALLADWAAAGFVVADPSYPRTTPGPGGVDESDIVHHPADLRAVIGQLTAGGAVLPGMVDASRVGIAGQSDGGDVTGAVAENTCCHDPAVKAAAVLSGAELSAFGGIYGDAPGVPLLVTQGSADPINVPSCSQQLYDAAPQPRYYVDLLGARHRSPYLASGPYTAAPAVAASYQRVVADTTLDFWERYLLGDQAAGTALRAAGTVPGVSELTAGGPVPVRGSCPGAPAR